MTIGTLLNLSTPLKEPVPLKVFTGADLRQKEIQVCQAHLTHPLAYKVLPFGFLGLSFIKSLCFYSIRIESPSLYLI